MLAQRSRTADPVASAAPLSVSKQLKGGVEHAYMRQQGKALRVRYSLSMSAVAPSRNATPIATRETTRRAQSAVPFSSAAKSTASRARTTTPGNVVTPATYAPPANPPKRVIPLEAKPTIHSPSQIPYRQGPRLFSSASAPSLMGSHKANTVSIERKLSTLMTYASLNNVVPGEDHG
jgi:hypothetical protein